MTEKFDAIVVGAGPAGSTAAYVMAKEKMNVAIIERGEYPGSKNVIGGVLYVKTLNDLIPDFWREAPLERRIIQHSYCLMGRTGHTFITHRNEVQSDPPNGYTILRSKFDKWYAKKAQDLGATLITKTNVTELIRQDEKIAGVRTDRGDLLADVTIVAEGANTMLCEKANLIKKPSPSGMAIAVKEIVSLPPDRIQERFGLDADQGTAIHYIGAPLEGLVGFGFVYPNKESISIGFGALISTMTKEKIKPYDLMERFKAAPPVERFLRDGQVKEYQAHMIPESGYSGMPKLFVDGALVVGDSAMLANPVTGEGADLAILSGRLAGEVSARANRAGDYGSNMLSHYERLLLNSFALKDMRKQSGLLRYIEHNLEIMNAYPEAINSALEEWFRIDGSTRSEKIHRIKHIVTSRRKGTRILRDAYTFWRRLM